MITWYWTAIVYVSAVVLYRVHKALGWCGEQTIRMKNEGKPIWPFREGLTRYWKNHSYVTVGDFIIQIVAGVAWASGLLSEVLLKMGIEVPEKPTPMVWYSLVFVVAWTASSFLTERLKNQYLKKVGLA